MPIIRLIPFLFLLIHYSEGITGDPVCVQQTPCSCRYNDGTGFDLNGLLPSNKSFSLRLSNSSILYFSPCNDINLSPNSTSCYGSLCLRTNDSYTLIGVAKDAHFSTVKDSNPNTLNITYKHTAPDFTTNIKLSCVPQDDTSVGLVENQLTSTFLNLVLFSHLSCRRDLPDENGASSGTIFLLILLLTGIVYFFGGAVLLYFWRGARGREMIPHVDFWADLPNLVRDGALFLQNGCKVIPAGQNVYDQI